MDITTREQLQALFKAPSEGAVKKVQHTLEPHIRAFIAASPFVLVSSANAEGHADVSPKGDPAGFVRVLDDHTLLIPERPGNNRLDTFYNLLDNPHVGLFFLVPGKRETLRVSGRARITTDAALLEPSKLHGKLPVAALVVSVDEAMFQCAKCIVRSELWNPERQAGAKQLATLGQVLADQIGGFDPVKMDERLEKAYRENLY
ncbi:MAG TPA: pyridoxamine 5'-phosphate oxidase family protein [bacterium]